MTNCRHFDQRPKGQNQEQEALQKSEERYRELVMTSLDGVISVDPEMRITVWNRGAERIFGYSEEHMLGRRLMDIIPERYREAKEQGFAAFRQTGLGPVIGQTLEVEGLHRDGTEVPVELSVSSAVVDGVPIATAIVRDITERKRAEEALRRRTAELEALQAVGLEITGQLDLDTVLHSIVSRAIELLSATMGGLYLLRPERDVLEWTTWVCEHAVPEDVVLRRGEGLSGKVWETGEPLIVDDYHSWEGRPAVWDDYPVVAVMGVPVRWGPSGDGGEFLGVLDVASDTPCAFSPADADLLNLFAGQAAIAIQNARLYERERERARELQSAYDELQRTQQALVKAERLVAMSQIGITVRHEINNPLTAVLGNAQLLLVADHTLSASSREVVQAIERAAYRIRDVVRKLEEIQDRPVPYLGETMMIDIHSDDDMPPQ